MHPSQSPQEKKNENINQDDELSNPLFTRNLLSSGVKENEFPKLFGELTPCKRNSMDISHNSSPPDSIMKRFCHFSPFFTTQTKRNISPVSPHTWQRLTSQIKQVRTQVPFEQLFQQSDSKQTEIKETNLISTLQFSSEQLLFSRKYWNEPLPPELPTALPPLRPEGAGCNCRSSRCLKLYCECLRKKQFCNGCNCIGCENHENSSYRQERVKFIEKKNPLAFQPVIAENEAKGDLLHQKGCNCRKSNCLKNYCECHQFGVSCGEFCKCKDCKNVKADHRSRVRPTNRMRVVSKSPI